MKKIEMNKLNNSKKEASSVIFLTVFFVIFLAFAAFAVDGTIVFTTRAKLQNITEMTALAAASEFNYSQNETDVSAIETHVSNSANTTFNLLKQDGLQYAKIDKMNVSTTSNKILVVSKVTAEPYFLAFLGVNGITLEAQACALSEPLPIKANYSGVNWLTTKAAYLSDIITNASTYYDTAILPPLGNMASASYMLGIADFSLITDDNGSKALSLGPGGFITIKLPAPVINKTGYDLYIREIGNIGSTGKTKEGYMVYAGIDNNPDNPYVKQEDAGSEISWVNISSCGDPEPEDSSFSGAHQYANTQISSSTDKFYGSGYFDIGKCGINVAKYIRIVDDNNESAFVTNNGTTYYKTMMYGEASTATAGADISYISVLNRVRLIPSTSF